MLKLDIDTSTVELSPPSQQPRRATRTSPRLVAAAALTLILSITALFAVSALLWLLPATGVPLVSPLRAHHAAPDPSPPPSFAGALRPELHASRAPAMIRLNWTVSTGVRAPDGVDKMVYLINDQFPGPLIEARSGDRLVIAVHNALSDEGLSMHWHGLDMNGHPEMDGAVGLTQCPLPPGETFVYDLRIASNQAGTFWYHSHNSLQRSDGVFGGLIVHSPVPLSRGQAPPKDYDEDLLLTVHDWYHRRALEVMAWYMNHRSWGNDPAPDSILINGRGRFPCDHAVPARPVVCQDEGYPIPYLPLEKGRKYRLRIIHSGSLTGVSLAFEHATIERVLTVDGGLAVDDVGTGIGSGNKSSLGMVYPGQRVDLVLRVDHDGGVFSVSLDRSDIDKFPNPALSTSQSFPITLSSPTASRALDTQLARTLPLPPDTDDMAPYIDLAALVSAPDVLSTVPQEPDRVFVVYSKIEKLAKNANKPVGYFNRTTWKAQAEPAVPLLFLERERWDRNQLPVFVKEGEWVELVLNNLDEGGHPFHLHGQPLHVLSVHESSMGWGSYNPFDPPPVDPTSSPSSPFADTAPPYALPPFNLSRSLAHDTVYIPTRGHAVLRFRAQRGVWMLHCHVMWHHGGGLGMVIGVEGEGQEGAIGGNWQGEECKWL